MDGQFEQLGMGYGGDGQQETNAMKALREKAEADSKRIADLEAQLSKISEQNRRAAVSSLIEQKGLNPQVAKFYNGDPDPDKVNAWVAENASLFGGASPEGTGSQEGTPNPPAPPAVPEDMQQAFLRMQMAGVDGVPPSNNAEINGALRSATDADELFTVLRNHGWAY
jgi:hypothetical protein